MNSVDTSVPIRAGYFFSFALHASVVAVAVYGLPVFTRDYMAQPTIPVDLVMFDDVKEADLATLPEINDLTPQERLAQANEIEPQVIRPSDLAEEVEEQPSESLETVDTAERSKSPPPDAAVAPDISTLPSLDDLAAASTPAPEPLPEATQPPMPLAKPEALQLASLVEPEPEPDPEPEKASAEVTELLEAAAEEPTAEKAAAEKPQQIAALAPPLPQRRPEVPKQAAKKEPKANDSNRLNAILRNVQKNLKQTEAKAAPAPAQKAAVRQGDAASSSRLAGLVRRQVQPCWNFDAGARDPASLIVEVRVFLNRDGSVSAQPEVLDRTRLLTDPFYRSAAERAQRAVLDCAPFKLPGDSYASWSSLLIRFNPAEAF